MAELTLIREHLVSQDPAAATTRTILVVDDDGDIRSALSDLLHGEGYAVAVAENGRVALDLLERGLRPSVVLLDLMMPVMDGWDFRAQQVRSPDLRHLPVVVITAAGFSAETVRVQFGDLPFIPKPPDPNVLVATIRRACADRDRES